MAKKKPSKVCSDCIHFHACQSWTSGILDDTDARPCRNYETVKDSNAYYLGQVDADKRNKPKKILHQYEPVIDGLDEESSNYEEVWRCPICYEFIDTTVDYLVPYCPCCGQALDWRND